MSFKRRQLSLGLSNHRAHPRHTSEATATWTVEFQTRTQHTQMDPATFGTTKTTHNNQQSHIPLDDLLRWVLIPFMTLFYLEKSTIFTWSVPWPQTLSQIYENAGKDTRCWCCCPLTSSQNKLRNHTIPPENCDCRSGASHRVLVCPAELFVYVA